MVRFSYADLPTWRRAVVNCTGTAAGVGLASAHACLRWPRSSAVRPGWPSSRLGLTLPGLMLQDSWRFSFFAVGRGSQAFLNDTGLGGGAAASIGVPAGHWPRERVLVRLCVGRGGDSRSRSRTAPGPGRAQSAGCTGVAVCNIVTSGSATLWRAPPNSASTQLRNYGIGIILGLAAVGYVQAASTLMGPFMVLLWARVWFVLPEATQVLAQLATAHADVLHAH